MLFRDSLFYLLHVALAVIPNANAAKLERRAAPNLPSSQKFKAIPLEELIGHNITHPRGTEDFVGPQPRDAGSACRANPNVRFEWRQYSQSDRVAFVQAIRCLMNKPPSGNFPPAANRYEDLARLHQNFMPNIHGNAKFIIWHRYFVWTFEQVLRAECGFNRAMPWWDETLDAGRFGQSDMFTNTDYFGHLPRSNNGQSTCIQSGTFSGLTCHIGPGAGNYPHCLSRGVDESLSAQCSSSYVNYCNSLGNYADFAQCLELGPHGFGHNAIGGVMSDVRSAVGDPIFFMHHLFIDHGFRIWQNGNVGVRTTTINGYDVHNDPLTMDTIVYMGGIRPDVRIRDIMNTLSGTVIGGVPFCYRYTY